MKKIDYSFLNSAKKMPPLKHKVGKEFDVNTSEVITWLLGQPKIKQKIFDMANQHGFIIYNSNTNTWQGCDYED
jgi:hypothetical protein